MFQLPAWALHFQGPNKMEGRALQQRGAVALEPPEDDELLRATCEDGDETHEIVIEPDPDGRHAQAQCSCEDSQAGRFCCHLWASLIALDASDDEADQRRFSAISRLKPKSPKARKRRSQRPSRPREPLWMGRLTLLRPQTTDSGRDAGDGIFPDQRQVIYTVLPGLSHRHQGLVVEVRQRSSTASGWSKPRPLRLTTPTVQELPSPVDRELCAMLLGADWAGPYEIHDASPHGRGHAMFRLTGGARQSLLRQMVATDRAFVETGDDESGESVPLRWDPGRDGADSPWTLWLWGMESDQGLTVDLQLRRLGKRLSVREPELILGGSDGVLIHQGWASTFNDHEAMRWIQQFRDHRYEDEANQDTAIRITVDEIPRFLERLYMLPALPHLDLPEGIGRDELRVEAVPHLDMFSPDGSWAAQLPSAVSKNQLLTRLWFDYAGQRVNPAKHGRFVALAGPDDSPAEDGQALLDSSTALQASGSSSLLSASSVLAEDEAPETVAIAESTATETESDTDTDTDTDADTDEQTAVTSVSEEPSAAPPPTAEQGQASEDQTVEPDETSEEPIDLEDEGSTEGLIRRDRRFERECAARLCQLGLRPSPSLGGDALLMPQRSLPSVVAALINEGWQVLADQRRLRRPGPPSLSVKSGIDWFELRGNVTFQHSSDEDDEGAFSLSLPELLQAAKSGRQMIRLEDGSTGLLPEAWLQEHGLLAALGELQDDHIRFQNGQAALLDAMLQDRELAEVDDRFTEVRRQLHSFRGIEPVSPPEAFEGELRPYQKFGLGWLSMLRLLRTGGILADDMGLGKTIQVLAMLQHRPDQRRTETQGQTLPAEDASPLNGGASPDGHRPSLIVAPRSVVFNWIDEAHRFTPGLRVLAYTGPDRQDLLKTIPDQDLVITSYGLMRRDIESLSGFAFDYAVLDEAQAIKNPQSQSAKAARLLNAQHRLALTGTPIENHLGDLWSIFEFLNPGMLGRHKAFNDFARGNNGPGRPAANPAMPPELEPEPGESVNTQIATTLRPFILRRTKSQVLSDLPQKTEQTILCEMEPAQRKIYDQIRSYYRGSLQRQIDQSSPSSNGGFGKASLMVLEALLRLRQAACHPALIAGSNADVGLEGDPAQTPSVKLDVLADRLRDIIDEGSKALVFSQFTSMLSLVRQRLDPMGVRYAYLDGQTRNRKDVVRQFQEDPDLNVFLISLKAGGVGLNLTAAEYVFILDPWWNPAVEAQAIDRTHRIGQTKPVFAYRLICENTVEQRILDLQQRKRGLAESIIGGDESMLRSLTREDLEMLLN